MHDDNKITIKRMTESLNEARRTQHASDRIIQRLQARLEFLISYMNIDDVGNDEVSAPGMCIRAQQLEEVLSVEIQGWHDYIEKLIDAAILTASRGAFVGKYGDTREEIARRARLSRHLDAIESGLNSINVELCALLPDPDNPDWMPALSNSNPADAQCLQAALDGVRELLALFT